MQSTFREIKFSDADVVNPNDFISAGEFNPHKVRPWLIHDHGFTVAVVFSTCEQDALDEAVDAGKFDGFQIAEADLGDYGPDGEGIAYLGNASEPFDIEGLDIIELPNPKFSFVALFNAREEKHGA